MRCIICKNKYKNLAIDYCKNGAKDVCFKCTLAGNANHQCDLDCIGALPTRIKSWPLSNSVIGLTPMGEIRGVAEEFFPRIFHYVCCNVSSINVTLTDLYNVHIEFDFTLTGNPKLIEQAYINEGWKSHHLKDYVKNNNYKGPLLMQVFGLYLWSGLRVKENSTSLLIDNQRTTIFPNSDIDFIGLPDCYPPEALLPSSKYYSYFVGKFSIFYAPLVFNKTYHFETDIEAINFNYEIGYLFPFRFTDINQFKLKEKSDYIIARYAYQRVNPLRLRFFPPTQEENWSRIIGHETRPPRIKPADTFRDSPLLGDFQDIKSFAGHTPSFNLSNYTIVRNKFHMARLSQKPLHSRVQITDSPLPVRIYDQLQKLPRYEDFLIEYDLINFSSEPITVELYSEIKGITEPHIENVTIKPPKNKDGEPARKLIHQCPRLKFGILDSIFQATEATFYYKITIINKDGSRLEQEQGTKQIKLLQHDVIIWALKDPVGKAEYDLSKLIGAWITPTDKEGKLDAIRGAAKDLHPEKRLVGGFQSKNILEVNSQVKAIYDYLNEFSGISYVEQSFSFTYSMGGQRVLLPERVLRAKTGNCIDLTVLFASLLEGLSINPLILLTKDHAFLGWGNQYKKAEMGFLECTLIGSINKETGKKYTFEEAFNCGKKEFEDGFLFIGSDEYIPINSIILGSSRGLIIDLEEVRNEGIKRY